METVPWMKQSRYVLVALRPALRFTCKKYRLHNILFSCYKVGDKSNSFDYQQLLWEAQRRETFKIALQVDFISHSKSYDSDVADYNSFACIRAFISASACIAAQIPFNCSSHAPVSL